MCNMHFCTFLKIYINVIQENLLHTHSHLIELPHCPIFLYFHRFPKSQSSWLRFILPSRSSFSAAERRLRISPMSFCLSAWLRVFLIFGLGLILSSFCGEIVSGIFNDCCAFLAMLWRLYLGVSFILIV